MPPEQIDPAKLYGAITGLNGKVDAMQSEMSRMAGALETLARVEERQVFQKEGMTRMGKEIDRQEELIGKLFEEISTLKTHAASSKTKVDISERAGWIFITAIVGVVASYIGYKIR